MAYTRSNPNTVFLGGPGTRIGDLAASAAITPGDLIERFNNAGVIRFRRHATAAGGGPALFAVEQSAVGLGPDDDYAANDLVEAVALGCGGTVWAFIASGQNITAGSKLESAGDGTLRVYNAGVILATALENSGAVTTKTRIRVEAA